MKLVSAIMPTRGRSQWAAQAVDCFLSQTYPNKELIILDDDDAPSFSDAAVEEIEAKRENVRWFGMVDRMTIAEKRNYAATLARGEIIWTLDDDDWSAPGRMADQIRRLEETGKSLTGYHSIPFFDGMNAYSHYMPARLLENFAMGTSLCYLKSWALENPFQDSPKRIDAYTRLNVASDNDLVARAAKQGQLATLACGQMMVARMHPGNSSSAKWNNRDSSPSWRRMPVDQLPKAFFGMAVPA